jgi:hypothetical protein
MSHEFAMNSGDEPFAGTLQLPSSIQADRGPALRRSHPLEPLMLRAILRSTSALAVFTTIAVVQPAFAAEPVADAAAKRRCNELMAFYDRWGATKTPDNSDGARNHNRIAAEFDCKRGDYAAGIAKMESQIHNRLRMDPPVDVGEGPMYFPNEKQPPAQALQPR